MPKVNQGAIPISDTLNSRLKTMTWRARGFGVVQSGTGMLPPNLPELPLLGSSVEEHLNQSDLKFSRKNIAILPFFEDAIFPRSVSSNF